MQYIAYYRVSTDKQGASGLGLEAQQEAVRHFLGVDPHATYVEVESGGCSTRPELAKAIEHCRAANATLVVAKLDRLTRDLKMLLNIMDAGTRVQCLDLPKDMDTTTATGRLTVQIMGGMAEFQRRRISENTKDALAAAKARGTKLGSPCIQKALQASIEAKQLMAKRFDAQVLPMIHKFQQAGHKTSRAIADQLTLAGVPTARGGTRWGHGQVCEILRRAA
jgi:DNA invertase Pin-like site-specific DNA recombinase